VCTLVGPHGHQVWPLIMVPAPSGLQYPFRVFMWLMYFVVVSQPLAMDPAPDLGWAAFMTIGPLTVLGLFFYLGDEWASSWCGLASVLCVFYLIAPLRCFKRCVKPADPVARAALADGRATQESGEGAAFLEDSGDEGSADPWPPTTDRAAAAAGAAGPPRCGDDNM
jgi:hypothetical protein